MLVNGRSRLCFCAVVALLICNHALVSNHALGENRPGSASTSTPTIGIDLTPKPVPRLQPGIVIGQEEAAGYSDLVTLVLPRLASGHIDSLPEFARRYAKMFKLTVLANVVPKTSNGNTTYLLEKVGVGFAMDIKDKTVVVTRDTANQFGAELGMIDRGVLGGNEDCLEDVVQIARTDQLIMFDAKANMLIGDSHEQRIIRHLIWATPRSGEIGFLVWMLKDRRSGPYEVVSANMQLLPAGLREDRQIHVSEGGFLSSIPTPDRFALVKLPQGKPIQFSDQMKRLAGKKSLTRVDLNQLVQATAESLAMSSGGQESRYR